MKANIAELKWKRQPKFVKTKKCNLEANILLNIPENSNPLKIYKVTTDFSELVQYICEQTILYAAQNGREFVTNPEEIRAYLGINYIMSISKVPNLKCCWSVDRFFSNEGVRNAMKRYRFMKILQNVHSADNQTVNKSDKPYRIRVVIRHLNKAFHAAMSEAEKQSVDEHMTKFKERMSSKQYMKKKPIKWDFKWWCWCCSKTGYLYKFDLYLGKKEKTELGLGETVVLDISKKLENSYCKLYFDNLFNSPALVAKLFVKGIYCIGTVRTDKKNMAVMKKDNAMKPRDIDFQYADNIVAVMVVLISLEPAWKVGIRFHLLVAE